jgi:hypothetical protein
MVKIIFRFLDSDVRHAGQSCRPPVGHMKSVAHFLEFARALRHLRVSPNRFAPQELEIEFKTVYLTRHQP